MQSGILSLTDIIGIAAFAFAGILAADGKKLDPVGVFVMAFTTAFGGGLVRDIIIDNRPFFWVAHSGYVWLTIQGVPPLFRLYLVGRRGPGIFLRGRHGVIAAGGAPTPARRHPGRVYGCFRRHDPRRLFKPDADGAL